MKEKTREEKGTWSSTGGFPGDAVWGYFLTVQSQTPSPPATCYVRHWAAVRKPTAACESYYSIIYD